MPYADISQRRAYQKKPEQKCKTADRQAAHRERMDHLRRLVAAYEITQKAGSDQLLGPKLKADIQANLPRIKRFIEHRNRQPVQVYVDGVRVK